MLRWNKIFLAIAMCCFGSCVQLYETNPQGDLKILVIDAMLSDENVQQKIRIRESVNTIDLNYYINTPLSKVEIIVNKKETLKLTAEDDGYYSLPKDFRAKVGDSYKLVFQKTDGTQYESNEQMLLKTPKIDKIYDEFLVNDLEKITKKYLLIMFTSISKTQKMKPIIIIGHGNFGSVRRYVAQSIL